MRKDKIETIDDYIASCPEAVRPKLEKLRRAILSAAPGAEESISYRMPAFKWNGPLVYFAAFKNHIGFFPTSSPIPVFKTELSAYETSKGTYPVPPRPADPGRPGEEDRQVQGEGKLHARESKPLPKA